MIKLYISEKLNELYNRAWSQPEPVVRVDDPNISQRQRLDLEAVMIGMGKKATILSDSKLRRYQFIDQFVLDQESRWKPSVVIELDVNKMLAGSKYSVAQRIKLIPTVLSLITEMTTLYDPDQHFQLILFVDSLFKLNQLGELNQLGMTEVMDHFNDMLVDSGIPYIVGSTPRDYERMAACNPAFCRRLAKVPLDSTVNV